MLIFVKFTIGLMAIWQQKLVGLVVELEIKCQFILLMVLVLQ